MTLIPFILSLGLWGWASESLDMRDACRLLLSQATTITIDGGETYAPKPIQELSRPVRSAAFKKYLLDHYDGDSLQQDFGFFLDLNWYELGGGLSSKLRTPHLKTTLWLTLKRDTVDVLAEFKDKESLATAIKTAFFSLNLQGAGAVISSSPEHLQLKIINLSLKGPKSRKSTALILSHLRN
jgi:hypothetical protein